jgi:CheY-like chemotaxis protein
MILLRRGRFRAAGIISLLCIWLMATAAIIQSRNFSGVAAIYYVALPVTGAWLFGFRAALGIMGLCGVTFMLVSALPVFVPETSVGTWSMLAIATIITTAPVARVLQLMKEALAQAGSLHAALRESHGQLQGLLRRSSMELAEARELADTAGRAKIALLARMSRELRPPLEAILGFSTLVRSGPGLSEGQRRDVEVISRSGEQVLELVNDALELSMIDGGYDSGTSADAAAPTDRALWQPEMEADEPRNDDLARLALGQPEQRILIVQDPREGSGLLQQLLLNAGFRVAVDEDGIECLEAFRAWRPDLVWLDLRLPGASCLEGARRVRALNWKQPVKVVAIATSPSCRENDELAEQGVDEFVHKPYVREEILDCLRRILGVRYNYGTNVPDMERGELLTPEALWVLPEKLCSQLEEALVLLDVDRVTALIGRIEVSYPALGEMLASLAGNLAYTSMLHALTARKANLVEERQ